jgi:hypothetical protein
MWGCGVCSYDGKVTAYLKDNRDGANARDYTDLSIIYMKDDSTEGLFYYLKVEQGYYGCGANQACLRSTHNVHVTTESGRTYVTGETSAGQDPDVVANDAAGKHVAAAVLPH